MDHPRASDTENLQHRLLDFEAALAELRRENDLLRQQVNVYQQVFSYGDALIGIDSMGTIVAWNEQSSRVFGWSAADAIGKQLATFIVPPRYRRAHAEGFRRYLSTGEARILNKRIEVTALNRAGDEFPIALVVFSVQQGNNTFFYGLCQDLTRTIRFEHRRAAQYHITQILAESSSLAEAAPRILQTACETANWEIGAMWINHPDEDILRCISIWDNNFLANDDFRNQSLSTNLKRGEDLPGRVWASGNSIWLGSLEQEAHVRQASAIAADLHGAFGFPIVVGDRVLGVLEFYSHEMRPPDGDLIALFRAVASQIAQFIEHQRAEGTKSRLGEDLKQKVLLLEVLNAELQSLSERLAKARDEAVAASRIKSQFLANMSHEIRTPMNAIIGMSELLLRSKLSNEQNEFTTLIRDSAENLLEIINDILDFSKVEAGKLQLELSDFCLADVIEGTVELMADKAREKQLCVSTFIAPDVPSTLCGDPGRVRQIVLNLVSNAVKFTNSGSVSISATLLSINAEIATVRIEVEDTGVGMSQEVLAQIFEPFTQADNSIARKYGGTGLGLSICSRLVSLMGGKIGVESEPGHGSRFWLEVPFAIGSALVESEPHRFTALSLLVFSHRNPVKHALNAYSLAWDIKCNTTSTPAEVLEVIEQAASQNHPIDAIIVDIDSQNSQVVIDNLNSSSPNIKKIAFTTRKDEASSQEAVASCDARVSSPLRQSVLFDYLSTLTGKGLPANKKSPSADRETEVKRLASNEVRILVAEDNLVNQKLALLQLKQLGFSADAVNTGAEAILAASSTPYALILMDCQMPEMDGYQATRTIRHNELNSGRHIPIIAMTAHAMQGAKERCLAEGMDDYLSKPVSPVKLAEVLNKWLPDLRVAEVERLLPPAEEVHTSERELSSREKHPSTSEN